MNYRAHNSMASGAVGRVTPCAPPPLGNRCALIIVLGLLVFSTGCSMLFKGRSAASAQIKSLQVMTNASGKPILLDVLQNQVQRYADTYAATVAQAVDDMETDEKDSDARIEAMRWKL